jgi:hypothetical protein
VELRAIIVQATDFIIATPDGVLDLEKSRELLKKITKTSEGHRDFHILIDFRTTDIKLSTVDIWEICRGLSEYGETFKRKTAILLREDGNFEKMRFLELCAFNRGFKINPFMDFEEAIMWLLPKNSAGEINQPD